MDWMRFAEQYGLSAAGLAVVFWYVIIPLKNRHEKFLDSVENTNGKLAGTIEQQVQILHSLQHGLTTLADNQKEMSSEVKKMAEIVERLSTVQQHLRMP